MRLKYVDDWILRSLRKTYLGESMTDEEIIVEFSEITQSKQCTLTLKWLEKRLIFLRKNELVEEGFPCKITPKGMNTILGRFPEMMHFGWKEKLMGGVIISMCIALAFVWYLALDKMFGTT